MGTRFYVETIATAPLVTPSSWSAGWNKTSGAVDRRLTPVRHSGNSTTITNAASGTAGHFTAIVRYVYGPLPAQTLSGTIKGQFRCQEQSDVDNFALAVAAKIIQSDGTDRGVLVGVSASDLVNSTPPEMAVAGVGLTNRKLNDSAESAAITLSSVAITAGDYLVLEIGAIQAGSSTSVNGIDLGVTDNSATDLAEDDTTTTADNCWVEFSQTLLLAPQYVGSLSTPLDLGTETSEPVTSAIVVSGLTFVNGDLVLLIGQLQVATSGQITVSATGGQTWTTASDVTGANDQVGAFFWCNFNGTWSADPSLAFAAQSGTQPATVVMHVFRGGGSSTAPGTWVADQAVAKVDAAAPGSPFTVTITGQTTTKTDVVTLASWFSADDNTWGTLSGTGWSVTGTAQYRNGGGSDQSASFAHIIQATAAATGNVSKNQATLGGDAGITFIGSWAWSPIAFDAASNSGYQAAASTYNWSHTFTGSDRFANIDVAILSVGGSVSSVDVGGLAASLVIGKTQGVYRIEKWKRDNPGSGAKTITVTLSGVLASAAAVISLTGVHQTSSTEGENSASAVNVGAADATVDVTTVANNDWVLDGVATSDTAITIGAGQTSRNNVTGAAGSGADSTEGPISPAAAVTMSWTSVGAAATWAIAAVGVRPNNASTLPTDVLWAQSVM